MKNTFLNRVTAERRVLSVVNGFFSNKYQLTGLSNASIKNWSNKVKIQSSSSIYLLLISLSEKCQRLSDRSNETFQAIEIEQMKNIESQLKELEEKLNQLIKENH